MKDKLPLFGGDKKRELLKQREKKEESIVPSNVVVLASHGSFFIPREIRKKLDPMFKSKIGEGGDAKGHLRIIKNFSDFASRRLLKGVPKDQRVIAISSRAIGDQNRPIPAGEEEGRFRGTDFKGHPVWKEDDKLTPEEKEKLFKIITNLITKKLLQPLKELKTTIKIKG